MPPGERMSAGSERVRVRRVYEPAEPSDGTRILVDRLWPRGVRKQNLAFDEWPKAVAPSPELRTWYGHRPERFEEFRRRYRDELVSDEAREAFDELRRRADVGVVTLLTATRDVDHSGAAVLAEALVTPPDRPRRERARGR
jgi:uncharacterized protein YeaO (DUF488 family)